MSDNNIPEKLDLKSMDISAENKAKLKQLFPSVFTETKDDKGQLVESIDFEKLKAELGTFSDVFESRRERYGMDWPGKKDAMKLIQQPSIGTLKPCREESVNFDDTENLFIEGDNLEVLKLLQKSYYGKVKMIYIDPPYNTGKEFIYPDKYAESLDTYLAYAGLVDSEGRKFATNTPNEGRFHTTWLNMMYPRLKLARNLLKDNGVFFISIGEIELANLKLLCNEIFGEENLVTICSRVMKTGGQKGVHFSPCIDYILIYAKNIYELTPIRAPISQNVIDKVYTKVEQSGNKAGEKYRSMGLYQAGLDKRANQRYYIKCPDGSFAIPPGSTFPEECEDGAQIKPADGDGVWRWTYPKFLEEKTKGNVEFLQSDRTSLLNQDGKPSKYNIYYKIWLNDRLENGQLPGNIIERFENRHSSAELKELHIPFDYAKPSNLIKYLISIIGPSDNDIIMDFFAGSCSTAHATLTLSSDINQNLRFLCVQLPEQTSLDSDEHKKGYKTIADIGKERIRRVIKKIQDEQAAKEEDAKDKLPGMAAEQQDNLDLGFKVFKLDKSNFKIWDGSNIDATEEQIGKQLEMHVDHINPDASQEDICSDPELCTSLN